MHPKDELLINLEKIAYDILNNIVAPVCGIKDIIADTWLTDIETYVFEDDVKREKILNLIEERYQLNEDELFYVDSYTTLIQIALYLYLRDRKGALNAT